MKRHISTSISLPNEYLQRLEEVCDRLQISRSMAVRQALNLLFASNPPPDDTSSRPDDQTAVQIQRLERIVARLDDKI